MKPGLTYVKEKDIFLQQNQVHKLFVIINSLEQYINEENVNTIIFKKSSLNQSLSDDLFNFRKDDYKGYYINNL